MRTRKNWLTTAALASLALVAWGCAELTPPPGRPTADVPPASFDLLSGPSLIDCPVDSSVSAQKMIGSDGGTVTAGGTTIRIPPGAVLLPHVFNVTVPASRYMEVSITAVGSAHYQFAVPVTVSIDYSRCAHEEVADAPLVAVYIDEVTKSLLQLMSGADDTAARTYTFWTDHLSGQRRRGLLRRNGGRRAGNRDPADAPPLLRPRTAARAAGGRGGAGRAAFAARAVYRRHRGGGGAHLRGAALHHAADGRDSRPHATRGRPAGRLNWRGLGRWGCGPHPPPGPPTEK